MRKPIIAGNWKMNKTASEAVRLAKQIKVLVADEVKGIEVVLCPPFTALYPVAEVIKGSGIQLGAQDVCKTEAVVSREVRAIVDGLELADPAHLVIAYEPIWAIGTGETATSQEANRVAALIREEIAAALGADVAREIRIQYGGSVKPENISAFMQEEEIDGALVGGASLDASTFAQIVKF
jgi:triosephosphate isomerase